MLDESLLRVLACPLDRTLLRVSGDMVVCEQGHRFAIEQGVPVFAENPRREPVPLNMAPVPEVCA